MILQNPTNKTVAIQIEGIKYSINPLDIKLITNRAHALHWLKTHKFLLVESEEVEVSSLAAEATTAEIPAEINTEVTVPTVEPTVVSETETEKVVQVKGSNLKPAKAKK